MPEAHQEVLEAGAQTLHNFTPDSLALVPQKVEEWPARSGEHRQRTRGGGLTKGALHLISSRPIGNTQQHARGRCRKLCICCDCRRSHRDPSCQWHPIAPLQILYAPVLPEHRCHLLKAAGHEEPHILCRVLHQLHQRIVQVGGIPAKEGS